MTQSQILIHQMSFQLNNGTALFNQLSIAFTGHKIGLVGRNGVGKSTLIKLIVGELKPHAGSIQVDGTIAYVPQNDSDPQHQSVAGLLGYEDKIRALHNIIEGSTEERDYALLNDDWAIEDRMQQMLSAFGLDYLPLQQSVNNLSGGEKTRLLLAKAFLSDADFLLLDEPTNHLDLSARAQLTQAIQQWKRGLIVISHDRALLNAMEEMVELSSLGAASYGGNYDDYAKQKAIEKSAREQQLIAAKKQSQKTQAAIQQTREKHERKQSYGRELKRSGSIDKLSANSKKGRSERTQSKMLIKEERLLSQAEMQLQTARERIENEELISVELPATRVPNGKVIMEIDNLHFAYPSTGSKIIDNFHLKVVGPERVALTGNNGSGKTTLVKLILKALMPCSGVINLGTTQVSYLDQHASLLKPNLSILENFLQLNPNANENDAYRSLAEFLFRNEAARKLVSELSGGEKLRALLACVLMSIVPPQLLILDEPTNHLDIHGLKSIESALKQYQGAMLVISHDQRFLENIGANRVIQLSASI